VPEPHRRREGAGGLGITVVSLCVGSLGPLGSDIGIKLPGGVAWLLFILALAGTVLGLGLIVHASGALDGWEFRRPIRRRRAEGEAPPPPLAVEGPPAPPEPDLDYEAQMRVQIRDMAERRAFELVQLRQSERNAFLECLFDVCALRGWQPPVGDPELPLCVNTPWDTSPPSITHLEGSPGSTR
jgi:hypothetical protein